MIIKLTYRELNDYKYQIKIDFLIQTGFYSQTCKTEFIVLTPDGMLWIKAGYSWNGSNWSSDKNAMFASLVHDALYQLMRLGLLGRKVFRKPADALYRDMCIAEGMLRLRARWRYIGLRWLAEGSTYPERKPRGQIKILTIKWAVRVWNFEKSGFEL